VHVALRDALVREVERVQALGGVQAGTAEEHEAQRHALRERGEGPGAIGRHVVGDEEDGLQIIASP